ncbi:MAG TPA: FkbM family methyltransferase [Methylobacterium sp.]|nr:FkbM family methyltransferase [Methylobacterium sp.]
MNHEYYYLGNSTALTKISGHNSYVCIDTGSWESLILAQGHPVEPDEISVMQRFLSPGDVFLDVGSNFGIYSAVASETIAHSGHIYAFEANPHTYKFLVKTAQANRLAYLGRHQFINRAVGPVDGETSFAFIPEGLGGGHIPFPGEDTSRQQVVTVEMVTLDNFLPADLIVNFCKVDVEGHELGVLQGMTDVIARSPEIRLLLEHYTGSDEVTTAGRAVVDFLRSIGLGVCVVRGPAVVPLADGEYPTGNVYLLATRTPAEDSTQRAGSRSVRPSGLQYHAVFKNSARPLTATDGRFSYRASDHQGVAEPALFFGPYIALEAGNYRLRFVGATGRGTGDLSLVHSLGVNIIAAQQVTDWAAPIEFTLADPVLDFEIVLRKTASLEELTFLSIALERA